MSKLSDKLGLSGSGFKQTDVPDLSGRTAIITGASTGIGLEVARGLALSSARVICLSRKLEKGEEAVEQLRANIKERTGREASIEWRLCDLADLRQVKECADKLAKEEERLDLLLAHAGIGVEKPDMTRDGLDAHLAIDHLGEMVLINRLLPLLRRTAKQWPSTTSCRIVSQSSEVHRSASLTSDAYDFSTPQAFKTNLSSPNQAYARGKLANILFIRHLATAAGFGQAKGPKTIRALLSHPGGVKTEQPVGFERSYGPVIGKLGTALVSLIGREPEEGALSMLWAATSPDVDAEGFQATYFDDPGHAREPSNKAQDTEIEEQFWRNSEIVIREVVGEDALLSWTQE